jgi:sugar phosphate isomerase/epimerase
MKIGCISWSHRNEFSENKLDIFSWVRHCARDAKLDGVEIWNNHLISLDPDYLDKILSLCKVEGIELYSVATKCLFGEFSEAEIKGAQETTRKWLEATDRLGAPLMRISIGGKELRNVDNQQIVLNSINEVINEGRYPNITVGIENQEPGVIQNITDVELMDKLSNGNLRLILDNGSIIDKSTVYEFMERAIPYSAVIHTKFFDIDETGADKVLDYDRIIPIIKESGYEGFLSIEYDSDRLASKDVPLIARYLRSKFARG